MAKVNVDTISLLPNRQVAIVNTETADSPSSMRRLRYITRAGCEFPNPPGFDGMRPCEVSRDICSRYIQPRAPRQGDATLLNIEAGRLAKDSLAGEPSMALLYR